MHIQGCEAKEENIYPFDAKIETRYDQKKPWRDWKLLVAL